MRTIATKKLTIAAVLATTALSAPAFAQAAPGNAPPTDVPPVHSKVDQFGVDLVTRNIAVQTWGSISIGHGGPGSLKVIISNSNRAGTDLSSGIDINGSTYSVYIAGATTTFTLNGTLGTGTFTNNQANGATLSYNSSTGQYTFTSANGTVLVLGISGISWPVSLTYPAGEQLTWNYDTSTSPPTLRSVTSNLGYQYRPTYSGTYPYQRITNIVLFNMASEPSCGPLAVTCTYANSWPSIDNVAATINGNPMTKWATTTNADGTSTVTETIPVTSTQNETFTYQVDANGRVTSVTDGNGTWTYNYNIGGGVTTIAGNGMNRTVAWSTTTGLVSEDILAPGNNASADITELGYDQYQRLDYVKHNNVTTTSTYDGNGNVTQTVTTDTNNANPITTSAVYPSSGCNAKTCNQPTSTTDANGNVTTYTYDPNSGGVATVTSPAAPNGIHPQARYTYALTNGVYLLTGTSTCQTIASCAGTADEVKTTIGYDSHANPITLSKGSGDGALTGTTTLTYTPQGDIQTVDGSLSGTTDTSWLSYDLDHRLLGTVGPLPGNGQPMRAVKVAYTTGGLVDTTSVGTASAQSITGLNAMTVLQRSQAQYNAQGLKTQDTTYDNTGATAGITQYNYTPDRRLQCTAVRNNSGTWTSQSNACAQTSTNTDLITKTTYDNLGNLLTVRNGYTSDSQVPDVTNTWLDGSMLQTQQDGKGNTTTYTYDTFNRLWQTKYPDIATVPTDYEQLTYDNNGNVYSRQTRSGALINYRYDALNRLTLKSSSVLPDVNYGYDLLGRMLSASNANMSLSFAYDALSRRTSETSPLGTVSSQYDLAGRRTRISTSQGYVLNFQSLTTGAMSSILDGNNGTLLSFGYDALGNRSSISRSGSSTSYGYDSLYRLHTLTHDLAGTANDLTRTIGYNPASQITSAASSNSAYAFTNNYNVNRTYTPNSLNQYASVAGTTFAYDGNGNLTSDGTNTFAYDAENRLTSAATGGVTTTLTYDPLGRLYQITKGSTVRRFVHDGSNVLSELDGSGALISHYGYGPGSDEPSIWWDVTSGGAMRMLHADERGSIVAISDASGNPVTINTYDEYGIPGSGNSTTERFQFTGQMYLPEIGMYYYKARMYSPTLGRFMQTDPIGYGDGMNWYAYTHNDPVNGVDPTGLEDCSYQNHSVDEVNTETGQVDQHLYSYVAVQCNGGGGAGQSFPSGYIPPYALAMKVPDSKTPTPCQKAFIKQELAARGMPTDQVDQLKFVSGLDANANDLTRRAFNGGATAVTQGSTVYVQPSRFDEISNFRSAIPFEEAFHSAQFASDPGFYNTYGMLSIGGWMFAGDSYKGNLYEAFAQGASQKMFNDYKSFACQSM